MYIPLYDLILVYAKGYLFSSRVYCILVQLTNKITISIIEKLNTLTRVLAFTGLAYPLFNHGCIKSCLTVNRCLGSV